MSKIKRTIIFVFLLVFVSTTMILSVACEDTKPLPEKKAIIILPGIMASAIYNEETDEAVWDPLPKAENAQLAQFFSGRLSEFLSEILAGYTLDEIAKILGEHLDSSDGYEGSMLKDMQLNPDGTSANPSVTAVPFDHDSRLIYGPFNAYMHMYEYLEDLYGDSHEVSVFNFDWRLSNLHNADMLEKYINENKYTDVVLIGHSMGGVLTSTYLAKSEANRKKVSKFISIGAPFLGALTALNIYEDLYSFISGLMPLLEEFGLANKEEGLLKMYEDLGIPMFKYMTSIYQLMPSAELLNTPHYQGENKAFLVENGKDLICSDTVEFYKSRPWAKDVDGDYFAGIKSLEPFWNGQYVMQDGEKVHSSLLVDTTYIAGRGFETAAVAVVQDGKLERNVMTFEGDGTVLLHSATLGLPLDDERIIIVDSSSHVPLACEYNEEIFNLIKGEIDEILK
ncbi:MAG: hypothetical protein IKC60_01445 [Clostridia bacterium]|nr:hypothetical protein [Clostridia bacterium]